MQNISSTQASAEVPINENFSALAHHEVFAKNPTTSSGLTWGYWGGRWSGVVIATGTLSLTASSDNYVVVQIGSAVISVSTSSTNWLDTSTYARAYLISTGTSSVSTVQDHRAGLAGVHGFLAATSGTVTSVAQTVPTEFVVSGSPITSTGTLAITKANQTANQVWAGPSSGAAAAPTFRSLVAADLPGQPFDLSAFWPGVTTASVKVTRVPVARAITFAAAFAGSYVKAAVAATASSAFDVQLNGASIGTITFAAAGTVATLATAGGATFTTAAGDLLAIIAPATPDATLADIGFVLTGTR